MKHNELNFKVIFECKDDELEEVRKRLTDSIIYKVRRMEGLFTTSWLPWSKSYYFSVRKVEV